MGRPQRPFWRLSAFPCLLAATYRLIGFEVVVAVDPHGPDLHRARDPTGTAQIAGPTPSRSAVS